MIYTMFYATYTGHIKSGVYPSWEECKREAGKRPKFKKFNTEEEALQFARFGPFGEEESSAVCVYTDGSSVQGKGGIGIYFGENDERNVSRAIGKATNNVAELTAVLECMKLMDDCTIYTDSTYAILCCTTYGDKCEKKGWDIPNSELVQEAHALYKSKSIKLCHINAHTTRCDIHSLGNRAADGLSRYPLRP